MVQAAGPGQMTDDWRCLELAHEGDEIAWRVLFQRHYASLVKMASCITGSLDSAHDLAQESFVRLLHAEISHRNGSFKSYLGTIAYRLSLKERKRHRSNHDLDTGSVADDSPSPLELAIQHETDRIIVGVIQSLANEQREILALRYFGGHSYEEIAQITEIPIGTVKSRIFYAVKICQEKLKARGVFK
jgi:RNA polymerase sigma-70 factor (ECF subfamily)